MNRRENKEQYEKDEEKEKEKEKLKSECVVLNSVLILVMCSMT
jgi:hypothetical protein